MKVILLTIAPIVIIVLYIYIKDKYDREPIQLLIKNFIGGAVLSILTTMAISMVIMKLFPITDNYSVWQQFIKAFIVVALVEEFSKYIIVRYYAQPKKAFNEQFDGIVYAVMVSMGFAFTENIFYVMEGGYSTALARAFTAVPAHATFGVLMGYYMGKAKFSNKPRMYNLMGLGLAVLFHGAYDFFLFISFVPGIWIGAFISLIVGIYFSRKAIRTHLKNSVFK